MRVLANELIETRLAQAGNWNDVPAQANGWSKMTKWLIENTADACIWETPGAREEESCIAQGMGVAAASLSGA